MRYYTEYYTEFEKLFKQTHEKTKFLKSIKLKQRNNIISFVNRYI